MRRLIFRAALFAINLGAALMSFWAGDWKKGLYWIASAICIGVVALE